MSDMEKAPLSELAEAILEDKWILCSATECLTAAIDEYLSRGESNPYTYNEEPVDPRAFMAAIGELLVWFSQNDDTMDEYA